MLIHVVLFASYPQALQYYQTGEYVQAIKEAKASKASYSNPNLHLLWAISATKLNKLNEAMSAYERVLLLDPSNTQAKKALEAIYKKTNRHKLLNKNTEKKLNANASISFGFDNNLAATPDSETLQDYFGENVEANKSSSPFIRFTGSLDYTHHFSQKDDWYIKYILKTYFQNNTDANFYNLKTVSATVGLGINKQKYKLFLPLSYHHVNYLGKDLLSQYRFSPKLLVPLGKNNLLDFNLIYSKNNYFTAEDKIKDDTTYAVEVGNYFLSEDNYFSTHFKYEHHSAINGFPSKYIAANFWTLKLGAKLLLSPKFLATANYRFRYGQYDDVVGTTLTTRDDNFHQLDTKLTYTLSKTNDLFIVNTYSENRSNYPAAVYQKNTILLGMDFKY